MIFPCLSPLGFRVCFFRSILRPDAHVKAPQSAGVFELMEAIRKFFYLRALNLNDGRKTDSGPKGRKKVKNYWKE